jgi:16S rRNA processing protein RimM
LSEQGESAVKSDAPLRKVLHIGKIVRTHGLRGEVKVLPLTNDPDRFCQLHECLLLSPDEKQCSNILLEGVKVVPDQIIIKLAGIDNREQADGLRGWLLAVRREQAVRLPPDQWFICDLIGCNVYDETGGWLGELVDILQNSAQDVYTVRLPKQPDLLFPAAKAILRQVDIIGRRIDICLPDGLYDVYRGRKS